MSSSQALFACTKCLKRHPFSELSAEEHLCKACRKKYPAVTCSYCRVEYHMTKKSKGGDPACQKCEKNLESYGQPQNCKYCNLRAAFKEARCARCIQSERKYGPPGTCDRCTLKCAFDRKAESKEKVGGQTLCLTCTLTYKRLLHSKKKADSKKDSKSAAVISSYRDNAKELSRLEAAKAAQKMKQRVPVSSSNDVVIAPLKKENLTVKVKEKMKIEPVVEPAASSNTESNSDGKEAFKDSSIEEQNKLKDKIAVLQKIIAQKDKLILEKDKKIAEYKGQEWERDRHFRMKQQAEQKAAMAQIDELKIANRTLQKQLKEQKKSRGRSLSRKAGKDGMHLGGGILITPDFRRSEKKTDSSKPATPMIDTPKTENTDEDKKPVDFVLQSAEHSEESETENKNGSADKEACNGLEGEDVMKGHLRSALEADDECTSSGLEDMEDIEKRRKKRKNKVIDDVNDGEVSSSGVDEGTESIDESAEPIKKKMKRVIDDDDDDEDTDNLKIDEIESKETDDKNITNSNTNGVENKPDNLSHNTIADDISAPTHPQTDSLVKNEDEDKKVSCSDNEQKDIKNKEEKELNGNIKEEDGDVSMKETDDSMEHENKTAENAEETSTVDDTTENSDDEPDESIVRHVLPDTPAESSEDETEHVNEAVPLTPGNSSSDSEQEPEQNPQPAADDGRESSSSSSSNDDQQQQAVENIDNKGNSAAEEPKVAKEDWEVSDASSSSDEEV